MFTLLLTVILVVCIGAVAADLLFGPEQPATPAAGSHGERWDPWRRWLAAGRRGIRRAVRALGRGLATAGQTGRRALGWLVGLVWHRPTHLARQTRTDLRARRSALHQRQAAHARHEAHRAHLATPHLPAPHTGPLNGSAAPTPVPNWYDDDDEDEPSLPPWYDEERDPLLAAWQGDSTSAPTPPLAPRPHADSTLPQPGPEITPPAPGSDDGALVAPGSDNGGLMVPGPDDTIEAPGHDDSTVVAGHNETLVMPGPDDTTVVMPGPDDTTVVMPSPDEDGGTLVLPGSDDATIEAPVPSRPRPAGPWTGLTSGAPTAPSPSRPAAPRGARVPLKVPRRDRLRALAKLSLLVFVLGVATASVLLAVIMTLTRAVGGV